MKGMTERPGSEGAFILSAPFDDVARKPVEATDLSEKIGNHLAVTGTALGECSRG